MSMNHRTAPIPQRLDYNRASPEAIRAIVGLDTVVRQSTLEPVLVDFVKVRASQLNGCSYCVDKHWRGRPLPIVSWWT